MYEVLGWLVCRPHGLRIDDEDNIWTTDLETHTVLKLNNRGQVLMVLGQRNTPGLYDDVRKMILFFKPADVAFASNGDVFIADGYGNHRVVQVSAQGDFIRSWESKAVRMEILTIPTILSWIEIGFM